jgi:hypothetical protein
MIWTTPTFQPLKMDAEIGSYQEDSEPARESPVGCEDHANERDAAT